MVNLAERSRPHISPRVCAYGTNQAIWRFCKLDFMQVCAELGAFTNYCSRSAPLWHNYDSAWGLGMDGFVLGRFGMDG